MCLNTTPHIRALWAPEIGKMPYIVTQDSDWPSPMPAIGHIANYSSLCKHRPRENQIYDSYFDRREAMPRFVRKPRTCIAQEGQTANFKCKVLAASPPVITWYFKNTLLNPSLKFMPKYSDSEYELRIGRAKIVDKGEYVVKAVNSFGVREESAALNVEQFNEHILWCALQCSWTKDGETLKSGDRYDIVYSLGISSLEISKCDASDAGKYACVAENSLGSCESVCRVTVNERKTSFKPSAVYLDTAPLSTSFSPSTSSYSYSSSSSSYPTGGASYNLGGYSSSSSNFININVNVNNYSNYSTSSNVRNVSSTSYRTTYRRTAQKPTSSSSSFSTTRHCHY